MRSFRLLPVILAFTISTAAFSEEPAAAAAANRPTWEVSGTTLVLQPAQPFEQGFIRVVGPSGYRASKSFAGNTSPALDLLADGEIDSGRRSLEENGASADERTQRSPITVLADGHYRFEAVLAGPGGTVRSHGSFFAEGGRALLRTRAEGTSEPAASHQPTASSPTSSGPVPNVATESEQVNISDNNNNGLTWLQLAANSEGGTSLENWQIQNNGGDLRIVEDGQNGGQNDTRLTLLQDTSNGRVGIGTTAPSTLLHLKSATLDTPKIRIGDAYGGVDEYWDLEVNYKDFNIVDSAGGKIIAVEKGAVPWSLVVTPGYIRVNNDFKVNGEFTVLSSRSAKQNFLRIDPLGVLDRVAALPIQEWEFRGADGVRHIGPFAEDFHHTFSLGSSDKTISPMDVGGVALAAIQGLQTEMQEQHTATSALLAEKNREIQQLRAEREILFERLAGLEEKVELLLAVSGN